MNAAYMRMWTFFILAVVLVKMWIDEDYERLERINVTFWVLVSLAFLFYTHCYYPHVRNGIWGFKYPYDLLVVYSCMLFLWPHLSITFSTCSTKKFAAKILAGTRAPNGVFFSQSLSPHPRLSTNPRA